MADLTRYTNKKLAKLLEAQCDRNTKSSYAVFALAAHGDERFSEIVARLGDSHPAVAASNADSAKLENLKAEARRRCGPVVFDMTSTYVTYLSR